MTVRIQQQNTASSFGYEWSKFNTIYKEYEDNFLSYVAPLDREFFRGKSVVDAGCGAGRHAHFLASYGASVLAFDLSEKVVEVARDNLAGMPGVTVAQADIGCLPESWRGKFDCAVCLGVLHHLPSPEEGFKNLLELLRPGGTIAIWVYGTDNNRLARWLYDPIRRLTCRLPHKVVYVATLPAAVVVAVCNHLHLPLFRQYARFPFRTKWNDAFDVFATPVVRYLDLETVERWFYEARLHDVTVAHRFLNGVRKGIKGQGVKP